jgi:hypothetical protein
LENADELEIQGIYRALLKTDDEIDTVPDLQTQRFGHAVTNDDAILVGVTQGTAFYVLKISANLVLRAWLYPLANDAEIAFAVIQYASKGQSGKNFFNARLTPQSGAQAIWLIDQICLWGTYLVFSIARFRNLQVAGLRMNDRFAKLDENVLHETTGQD